MRVGGTVLLVLALVAAIGCRGAVTVPRLTPVGSLDGFKMLKPAARARECRPGAIWESRGAAEEELATRALQRLLALDDEADAVLDARLEWTWWTIGVYGRRCVTLTGDVVRSVRTVVLPMPGHESGHGAHGEHAGHEAH